MPQKKPRSIAYTVMAPVGPGRLKKSGALVDLLFDIPYFFLVKVVPPLFVVNEMLRRGVVNAGMSGGCRWRAFEIAEEEYDTLVANLQTFGFERIELPEWVSTSEDWRDWVVELAWGVPALENRKLTREISELEKQHGLAEARGDQAKASELLTRMNDLCFQHSRFVDKHRLSSPRIPRALRPQPAGPDKTP